MANISYGVNLLPKTNNAYTLGNSDYKWSNIYGVNLKLSGDGHAQGDLYVGCASDYTGGAKVVKETDYATSSKAGLVRIQGNGLYMDGNQLLINKALDDNIRLANHGYSPIVPTKQHLAVFYGLATAAGDTTQPTSGNTVGTYTDSAKIAIQKMLGIYQAPWELIRSDDMTNATEDNIEITVDDDGNAFELTDIIVWLTMYSKDNTASSMGDYGRIRYVYGTGSGDYDDTISGAINVAAGGSARGFYTYIEQQGPLLRKMMTTQTTVSNNSGLTNYTTNNFSSQIAPALLISSPRYYNKIIFKKITGSVKFKIYGKRRWT